MILRNFRSLSAAWNRFFFDPADPRTYAYLRIGFGCLLLINGAVLGPDWLRWFSDSGVLDRAAARAIMDPDTWSLFNWIPDSPAVLWACYAVFMGQALALTLGFFPRTQAVCLFIWLLSLHHRNSLIWDGEDLLLRLVCFLLIFMPLGASWSLGPRAKPPGQAYLWQLRLLQIQLCFLYVSSVLSKLLGEAWRDGTAMYYAFHLDDFAGRADWLTGILEIVWILKLATWLTLAIEMLLVVGVWAPRMRLPTIVIGILFHLAIELALNLFLFQWLMILLISTHLRPQDWANFISLTRRSPKQWFAAWR